MDRDKLQKGKDYFFPEKRGAEEEQNGAQDDGKRTTIVTELAEGKSSSLIITCG